MNVSNIYKKYVEFKQSSKGKKLINIMFIVVACICISLFSYAYCQKSFQNDTFYTIKIGELITQNGIDYKDHFANTDLPYTYPHWLFDFLVYQVYNVFEGFGFGYLGLYLLAIILTNVLGFSFFYILNKKSKSKVVSLIFTLLGLFMLRGYLALRAQIVTYTLFIWAYYFIDNIATQEKFKIGNAIGLVLISLTIANLHCATWPFLFVLFLPYIAQYLLFNIEEFCLYSKLKIKDLKHFIKLDNKKIEKLEKTKPENYEEKIQALKDKNIRIENKLTEIYEQNEEIRQRRDGKKAYKVLFTNLPNVKYLLIVMVICILMGFVTPLKLAPFTYLYDTLRGNTTNCINEHLPMSLVDYKDEWIALCVMIGVLAFTRSKISLYNLFMICGLSFMMITSRRQLTLYTLIGGACFSQVITSIGKKEEIEKLDKLVITPSVLILTLVLISIITYGKYKDLKNEAYINTNDYPVEATKFIKNNLDYKNIKLYNEYNYGSYLLMNDIPVFIDSRADLYAPEFNGELNIFGDFIDVSSLDVWYDEIFDKYGFTHFIIYNNNKVNMVIEHLDQSRFKRIYKDNNFSIYEKVESEGIQGTSTTVDN